MKKRNPVFWFSFFLLTVFLALPTAFAHANKPLIMDFGSIAPVQKMSLCFSLHPPGAPHTSSPVQRHGAFRRQNRKPDSGGTPYFYSRPFHTKQRDANRLSPPDPAFAFRAARRIRRLDLCGLPGPQNDTTLPLTGQNQDPTLDPHRTGKLYAAA